MTFLWTMIAPYLGRILLYASIAAMIGGGFLWVKTHYYNLGWETAIHSIATENKEAVNAANKRRKEVGDCVASGGEWDTASGVCAKP